VADASFHGGDGTVPSRPREGTGGGCIALAWPAPAKPRPCCAPPGLALAQGAERWRNWQGTRPSCVPIDLDHLLGHFPIAAVEPGFDRRALRFEAKAALPLLLRADPKVGDVLAAMPCHARCPCWCNEHSHFLDWLSRSAAKLQGLYRYHARPHPARACSETAP
jgi:hypothetical protein